MRASAWSVSAAGCAGIALIFMASVGCEPGGTTTPPPSSGGGGSGNNNGGLPGLGGNNNGGLPGLDNGNSDSVSNDNVNDNTSDPGGNTNDNGGEAIDTDGDGFSDDEEINGVPGTDPMDPTDNPDNVRDSDGDGCSDFDEENFAGFCDNNPNTPGGGGGGGSVQVSGRVSVGQSSVVDGDTNDPTNAVVPNNPDTFPNVQQLPNPCTLGGYLGNINGVADISDVYLVQAAANQSASLLLANPQANDFDLFLYDEAGQVIGSSEGTGKAEQVQFPTNGVFFVEVYGFSVEMSGDAGGLYTLLIGNAAFGAGLVAPLDRLSSLTEFVPDEVLVGYKPGTVRSMQAFTDNGVEAEVLNRADESGGVERLRIKSVRRSGNVRVGAAAAKTSNAPLQRPYSATIAAVKHLRRQQNVEYAEPNYIRKPFQEGPVTPNDEFFGFQWHYNQIGLPDAWSITTGDPSVVVAVVDTGVVLAHPDLANQLTNDGIDMISDPSISRDGDGIDADPNDPGDLGIQGTQSTFHGTHVSGTVAAATNNSLGVAGVAWDVRVMPVRVLGQGGGTEFDIVQGILYAAGLPNASNTVPNQPADVINLSLGGQGSSTAEQNAINDARAAGSIVIAAAGNEASNADFVSPAGLDGVVTVSAVGFNRNLAPYSNFGTTVDIAAPGGDMTVDANSDTFADGVLSTLATDNGEFIVEFSQGTSMACPHVAGVAALMKSVNPNMTPEDFDMLIQGTHPGTSIVITDDLGSPGFDNQFGFGLINAFNAVRAAAEIAGMNAVDTPLIQIVPGSLDFGASETSADVEVRNAGVDTLNVSAVQVSDDWLSVNPTSGGAGLYTVSVSRTGLNDGVYTGSVTFSSNGGTATASVRMSVGEVMASGGDIGTVYVLILDLEVFATVDQYNATVGESYIFEFNDVFPSQYGLFAGTDMNNDGFIDDIGEAVGGYPTLIEPAIVDANQSRAGLNFNVSYDINVQKPTSALPPTKQHNLPGRLQRLDR